MHRPDEDEGHVERHDGDEEEITRRKYSGERSRQSKKRLVSSGEQNSKTNKGEGDQEGSAKMVRVEERCAGAAFIGLRAVETDGAENVIEHPERGSNDEWLEQES